MWLYFSLARVLEYMLYLLPFQIPDFIEAVELLQTKLLVLLPGVFVQSLEDAHHLPLSCNDNSNEITCPVAIYFSVVICRVSDACIQRIHYKLSATFSDKYRWPNFTRSLGWHNPVDKCVHYIDDLLLYKPLCSYWVCMWSNFSL